VKSLTPRPLYPGDRPLVPIEQETEWAYSRSGLSREETEFAPAGIPIPDLNSYATKNEYFSSEEDSVCFLLAEHSCNLQWNIHGKICGKISILDLTDKQKEKWHRF
jgi:hypothetical protein